VLVTREETERREGVDEGTLLVVGTDPGRIEYEANRLLTDPLAYNEMREARNPYGDGHAADRIVAALEHIVNGGQPPSPFGAGFNRRAVIDAAAFQGSMEAMNAAMAAAGAKEEAAEVADEQWLT
jgi:UDP-N-acetylglucosamine 2-epimerase (non-hydrolysing)